MNNTYTDPFDGNDYGDEQEENECWNEDILMTRRWEESGEQGNEIPFYAPTNN